MIESAKTAVAIVYGIKIDQITSNTKKDPMPEARRIITLILIERKLKQGAIAKAINRHRTTVNAHKKKVLFELKYYKDVKNNYQKSKLLMSEILINKARRIERWLTQNPEAEWQLRFDKIKELAELNEQINENTTI